jgi:hypothetical protein
MEHLARRQAPRYLQQEGGGEGGLIGGTTGSDSNKESKSSRGERWVLAEEATEDSSKTTCQKINK